MNETEQRIGIQFSVIAYDIPQVFAKTENRKQISPVRGWQISVGMKSESSLTLPGKAATYPRRRSVEEITDSP